MLKPSPSAPSQRSARSTCVEASLSLCPQPRGLSAALPPHRYPSPWMLLCPEPASWTQATHSQHRPANASFSLPTPQGQRGQRVSFSGHLQGMLGPTGNSWKRSVRFPTLPPRPQPSSICDVGWVVRGHGTFPGSKMGVRP